MFTWGTTGLDANEFVISTVAARLLALYRASCGSRALGGSCSSTTLAFFPPASSRASAAIPSTNDREPCCICRLGVFHSPMCCPSHALPSVQQTRESIKTAAATRVSSRASASTPGNPHYEKNRHKRISSDHVPASCKVRSPPWRRGPLMSRRPHLVNHLETVAVIAQSISHHHPEACYANHVTLRRMPRERQKLSSRLRLSLGCFGLGLGFGAGSGGIALLFLGRRCGLCRLGVGLFSLG